MLEETESDVESLGSLADDREVGDFEHVEHQVTEGLLWFSIHVLYGSSNHEISSNPWLEQQ